MTDDKVESHGAAKKRDRFVFSEESSVHGIREVLSSPVKWHRGIWLIVMVAALISTAFQLQRINEEYWEDRVGTRVGGYVPTSLPPTMVCPWFRYIKPEAETGVSDHMFNYINGFYPQSQAFYHLALVREGKVRNPAEVDGVVDAVERMFQKHNYSSEAVLESVALESRQVFTSVTGFPIAFTHDVNFARLVTSTGPCYMADVNSVLTEALSEYRGYQVVLNDSYSVEQSLGSTIYFLYIGDRGYLAVQPPIASLEIRKGETSFIQVRVTKKIRYPGRDRKYCREYDRSDRKHCMIMEANRRFFHECTYPAPTSSLYPEAKRNETSCNLYTQPPWLYLLEQDEVNILEQACPVTCDEQIYDRVLQIRPGITSVIVMMDSLPFSQTIEEYPLVTMSDLLSSVGGTLGFFFGASVLSLVQLAFYCFGAPCCCPGRNKRCGASTRAYMWA